MDEMENKITLKRKELFLVKLLAASQGAFVGLVVFAIVLKILLIIQGDLT